MEANSDRSRGEIRLSKGFSLLSVFPSSSRLLSPAEGKKKTTILCLTHFDLRQGKIGRSWRKKERNKGKRRRRKKEEREEEEKEEGEEEEEEKEEEKEEKKRRKRRRKTGKKKKKNKIKNKKI